MKRTYVEDEKEDQSTQPFFDWLDPAVIRKIVASCTIPTIYVLKFTSRFFRDTCHSVATSPSESPLYRHIGCSTPARKIRHGCANGPDVSPDVSPPANRRDAAGEGDPNGGGEGDVVVEKDDTSAKILYQIHLCDIWGSIIGPIMEEGNLSLMMYLFHDFAFPSLKTGPTGPPYVCEYAVNLEKKWIIIRNPTRSVARSGSIELLEWIFDENRGLQRYNPIFACYWAAKSGHLDMIEHIYSKLSSDGEWMMHVASWWLPQEKREDNLPPSVEPDDERATKKEARPYDIVWEGVSEKLLEMVLCGAAKRGRIRVLEWAAKKTRFREASVCEAATKNRARLGYAIDGRVDGIQTLNWLTSNGWDSNSEIIKTFVTRKVGGQLKNQNLIYIDRESPKPVPE